MKSVISCTQCLVGEQYMALLSEWIAYHHIQGVEHKYIYANGLSVKMCAFRSPLIKDGIVTVVDLHWPEAFNGVFTFQQSQDPAVFTFQQSQDRLLRRQIVS